MRKIYSFTEYTESWHLDEKQKENETFLKAKEILFYFHEKSTRFFSKSSGRCRRNEIDAQTHFLFVGQEQLDLYSHLILEMVDWGRSLKVNWMKMAFYFHSLSPKAKAAWIPFHLKVPLTFTADVITNKNTKFHFQINFDVFDALLMKIQQKKVSAVQSSKAEINSKKGATKRAIRCADLAH